MDWLSDLPLGPIIIIAVLLVIATILASREWFRVKHERQQRELVQDSLKASDLRIRTIKNEIADHEKKFRDILSNLEDSYDSVKGIVNKSEKENPDAR